MHQFERVFLAVDLPDRPRMHSSACLLDTNRRTVLAHFLLDRVSSQDVSPASLGHSSACPGRVLDAMTAHPCHQAAAHLACTRPPDYCRLSPSDHAYTTVLATAAVPTSEPLSPRDLDLPREDNIEEACTDFRAPRPAQASLLKRSCSTGSGNFFRTAPAGLPMSTRTIPPPAFATTLIVSTLIGESQGNLSHDLQRGLQPST
jgi:hypothetical protein